MKAIFIEIATSVASACVFSVVLFKYQNKTDIIRAVTGLLSDALDKKRFGEYGIYITMNDEAQVQMSRRFFTVWVRNIFQFYFLIQRSLVITCKKASCNF